MKKYFALAASHLITLALGFALGIYALPILIAPPAPSESEVVELSAGSTFQAEFVRDLKGSDAFHWGEGEVSLGGGYVTFMGKLSPGPDYKLYLSPEFVENAVPVKAPF